MKGKLKIKNELEIDFLKSKTYQEINDIFNELNCKMSKKEEEKKALIDFCIWMTGCGYDFTKHKYFIKQRDKLLKQ